MLISCSTNKPPEVVYIQPVYPVYGDTPNPKVPIKVWSDLLLWKAEAELLIAKSNAEKQAIYRAIKKDVSK